MAKLLKDLYNAEYINLLALQSAYFYPKFKQNKFIKDIFNSSFKELELKQRMRHISTTLGTHLPNNYKESIEILKNIFSTMNYAYNLQNMIFQDFVEVFGLDDFEVSMDALEHFTINSSSEFAIRQFIINTQTQSMKQMTLWSRSKNSHIRRLASEGCRPRLPWAVALPYFKKNPLEVLKILELLKDDESKYVRKSVANNLNDISKDNPKIIKQITKKWINQNKNRDALLKHGCRTLLKSSDKETLELFGFNEPLDIKIKNFKLPNNIALGSELNFSFDILSDKELSKLRVEFSIDFLRKNGTHNTKVFKIIEGTYSANQKSISKNYSFKKITTRVYYRGLHRVSIIINGVSFATKEFYLS